MRMYWPMASVEPNKFSRTVSPMTHTLVLSCSSDSDQLSPFANVKPRTAQYARETPIAVVGVFLSLQTTCTPVPLNGTTATTLCASLAIASPSASVRRPVALCRAPDACVDCGQM